MMAAIQRKTDWFPYLLLLPATAYIVTIVAYPLVDTINLSFTNAALKPGHEYVGWANYQKIFKGHFAEVI